MISRVCHLLTLFNPPLDGSLSEKIKNVVLRNNLKRTLHKFFHRCFIAHAPLAFGYQQPHHQPAAFSRAAHAV